MIVSLSVPRRPEFPATRALSGRLPGGSAPASAALDTRGNKSTAARPDGRRTLPERAVYEAARQARRGGQARAVAGSYDAIGESERAERIRSCGRLVVYGCDGGCGALHGRHAYHCRDRLCPYCAVLRGHHLAEKVLPLVQAMARPLFLTLTVQNGPDLAERGRHLRRAFERLRRRRVWTDHIAGGIAIEEVTHNGEAGTWHPHLHVVVESALPAAALLPLIRAVWRDLTGDSYIVDVRPLTDVREACKYTAKLATIVYSPALVAEFTAYAARRRMVVPFGACYGAAAVLVAVEGEVPAVEVGPVEERACPGCGALGTLRRVYGHGWSLAEAVPIGDGWYTPCRTSGEWLAVLRARRRPPAG